ncbi:hypothetical protein D3C71_1667870 [compost metagenome]
MLSSPSRMRATFSSVSFPEVLRFAVAMAIRCSRVLGLPFIFAPLLERCMCSNSTQSEGLAQVIAMVLARSSLRCRIPQTRRRAERSVPPQAAYMAGPRSGSMRPVHSMQPSTARQRP